MSMIQLKDTLKDYVQSSLKIKNLKLEKQKINIDIKQEEMTLLNLQEQILEQMKDLGITEDEINLGSNMIVKKTQIKKTKGVTIKDIEDEFIRQNGNAITFNQIVNSLKEKRKADAEIKTALKLKVPNKLI